MMARLGAVFLFFVGVVAFFADAALGLGRSMEPQTVPGTFVEAGEELSGKAPHFDDDDKDDCGYWLYVKRLLRVTPSTPEEIHKRWTDTFELDCSLLGQPLGEVTPSPSNWMRYLRPMPQSIGACAIMACIMAIEGMHVKVYEMFHGPETFPVGWKASESWIKQLPKKLESEGIWKKGVGAVVSEVLMILILNFGGVKTESGQGQQEVMPLGKFEKHSGEDLTSEHVATLLDQGPCVGRLWACPWYSCFDANATEKKDWVYRGCGRDTAKRDECRGLYPDEEDVGSHAVVCMAYRKCQNGEMHVLVLDNHTKGGPERWVHVEELDAVYSFKVDCMCGCAEHHHDALASLLQKHPRRVRNASGQGLQLVMPLPKFNKHSGDDLTSERVATLLDQGLSCVGSLEEDVGSHAVVCFGYRCFQNGEMHLLVLENHTAGGSQRWIHVEEMDAVYSFEVDCMCDDPDQHHHDAGASPGTVIT